jgi:hypothetical protein
MTTDSHPTPTQSQPGAAEGPIIVQDHFLDERDRIALLSRATAATSAEEAARGGLRKLLGVPAWLSNSLVAVLGRGGKEVAEEAFAASDAEVLLPMYEMTGDHPEHQDRHVSGAKQGALADGHVGVVYLEGDGAFVLTNTATGAEHRVPIAPGKLVSWPNALFSHRVEGASPHVRRRMLGPMALDAASTELVGVGGIPTPFTPP